MEESDDEKNLNTLYSRLLNSTPPSRGNHPCGDVHINVLYSGRLISTLHRERSISSSTEVSMSFTADVSFLLNEAKHGDIEIAYQCPLQRTSHFYDRFDRRHRNKEWCINVLYSGRLISTSPFIFPVFMPFFKGLFAGIFLIISHVRNKVAHL